MPDGDPFPNMDLGPRKDPWGNNNEPRSSPREPQPQSRPQQFPPELPPPSRERERRSDDDEGRPQPFGTGGEKKIIGERVLAPRGKAWLYPGRIHELQGDQFYVLFDDGKQEWVPAADVRPLEIKVGSRISCRWKEGWVFYSGTVAEKDGEGIFIHYDDGDKEWNRISMIRVSTNGKESFLQNTGSCLGRIGMGLGILFLIRVVIWILFSVFR